MRVIGLTRAVAVAAGLLLSVGVQAKTLWESDFVNKGIEQFDIFDVGPQINPDFKQSSGPSHWFVKNGVLDQSSNIYGTPDPSSGDDNPYSGTQAIVKDFTTQDGIFFTQFKTNDNDGFALVFRWQDEKNFMRALSEQDPGNAGPITRLEKWTDGQMQILDLTRDVTYQPGKFETMLVTANGPDIQLYLGDLSKPLLTAKDSDPKPGRFGLALYAMSGLGVTKLEAVSADSTIYSATLTDKSNNPISEKWVSLAQNGQAVAGSFTNTSGSTLFVDTPPGTYDLAVSGLTTTTAAPATATVKPGTNSEAFTLDVQSTPQVLDLSSSAGAAWKIKLPAAATDDFRDPAASETGFADYTAPSDWSSVDPTKPTYGWLRVHVAVPASAVGKDLALTGWDFTQQDWTYWNGQYIGGDNTPGETRTYVIPGSLVKADNVVAIRGLNTDGAGGIINNAPVLQIANPSVTVTGTVVDASGKPVGGVEVDANSTADTLWGPQTGSGITGSDGVYRISGLAPGSYEITRVPRLDLDPAAGDTQTKTAAGGDTVTANFTVSPRPSLSLSTIDGAKWLVLYGTDPSDTQEAKPTGVDETKYQAVYVPGDLQAQGSGDSNSLFWYRTHVTIPDNWKSFMGRDLILTGFNVDDADVTYFNGQKIGGTGALPTDPTDPGNTGYVGSYSTIRAYTIPGSLVNWNGDNVIAINGFNGGGNAGITLSPPVLVVAPGAAGATVACGDVNEDSAVDIKDATLALAFAVGLKTPADDTVKGAMDVNGDGKLSIADVTLILQKAVDPTRTLSGPACK